MSVGVASFVLNVWLPGLITHAYVTVPTAFDAFAVRVQLRPLHDFVTEAVNVGGGGGGGSVPPPLPAPTKPMYSSLFTVLPGSPLTTFDVALVTSAAPT